MSTPISTPLLEHFKTVIAANLGKAPTLTFFADGDVIGKGDSLLTKKAITAGTVLVGMVSRGNPFVFKRFDPNYEL